VVDKRRTEPDRHLPLKALATRQHGVVSTRQLKTLGYTRQSASKANGVGRLQRLHRGVYAVGHTDLTWNGQCMAAVLACTPVVASHWTAAWLWGLMQKRPEGRFHLTAGTRRHRKREFVVHFAALAAEDVAEREGIPVTSLARTLLDLAAHLSPEALEAFLERAEKQKDFDLRRFESLLARTSHHPGYGPLERALAAYRPEPVLLRSKLEKRFRILLRASSLPLPSHNVNVGPYELDCYWPDYCFCVELDTYGTHGSRRSFESDRKRQRELRRLGIEVDRVTDRQLEREPEAVLAALAEALERRGVEPAA
jgi:very-short-patch-repair endonuclease